MIWVGEHWQCVRFLVQFRNRPPDRFFVHSRILNRVPGSLGKMCRLIHLRGTCLVRPKSRVPGFSLSVEYSFLVESIQLNNFTLHSASTFLVESIQLKIFTLP